MPRPKLSTKVPGARCACGCGLHVPEGRVLYFNDTHSHRVAVRRYQARTAAVRKARKRTLAQRFLAGEGFDELAASSGLTSLEVQAVVRSALKLRRKV